MRANYLYIFGFADPNGRNDLNKETRESIAGLYKKYGGRSGPTALMWVEPPDKVEVLGSLGDIPLNKDFTDKGSKDKSQITDDKKVKGKVEVGVYAVLHGVTGATMIEDGDVANMVSAFGQAIPEAQCKQLTKVALVQCFATKGANQELNNIIPKEPNLPALSSYKDKELPPLNKLESGSVNDIVRLMALLREKGMTPMIAGWEGYIGVNGEGQKILSKSYNPNTKTSTYGRVVEKERSGAHRKKHVYQVNKEGKVCIDFDGWSDR
jgi:hypothetical protein